MVLREGRVVAPGKVRFSERTDADRFFGGVELFKAGKAPVLVFTGGAAPWEANALPQGELPHRLCNRHGRSGQADQEHASCGKHRGGSGICRESDARCFVAFRTAGTSCVLLVTSAFHRVPAQTPFERAGMSVIPVPVDFNVSAGSTLSVLDFLPTTGALAQMEMATRGGYGGALYSVIR